MAYRILLEVLIFLLPFFAFGLYRLLITDAETEGRKTWPIRTLFAIGAVLAIGLWVFFILREDKVRDVCWTPPTYDAENKVLIPAKRVPCKQDVTRVGEPANDIPDRLLPEVPEPAEGVDPEGDEAPRDEAPRGGPD